MSKKITLIITCLFLIQFSNAQCFEKVSYGGEHSLAIKANGSLWTAGSNQYGQNGSGSGIMSPSFTQIGTATNWNKASGGGLHSFAIKNNGTLWGCGYNYWGQLGNGTTTILIAFTQIGTANNWAQVSAGNNHTIAIKTDGTIWAWGHDGYGQLGNGIASPSPAPTLPVQIGTDSTWTAISAGESHNLALKSNGTLWSWGRNSQGQLGIGSLADNYVPVQVGTANNWAEIAAGSFHSLAIKNDSTLWAWGENSDGQLGNGGMPVDQTSPIQVGLFTDWNSVDGGSSHSVATRSNGTYWAFGSNTYSQLGNGTTVSSSVPIQVGSASIWKYAICGWFYNGGMMTDQSFWVWGRNNKGQAGNGASTATDISTPMIVPILGCGPTSTDDIRKNNIINVFPNPVSNILHIKTANAPLVKQVEILTMDGKVVYQHQGSINEINIHYLPSGLYMLDVNQGQQHSRIKFGKE
jgi:alpha-tubulin suppressor-like RCC1 family protein